ncbi:hypothetical protein [Tenacibaculum xiamenense]|uniref:hypothetical protein n=1 Tax=Tenacibaculum xiamenense TaxID=1261553 RepID=UPI0038B69944
MKMKSEQKEAIAFLVQCAEYAQGKGVFNLTEAHTIFNSIKELSPILEEKE